jgi:NADPH2:quinone reductase
MSFAQATSLVNYQSACFGLVDRGAARGRGAHPRRGGRRRQRGGRAGERVRLTSIAVARGEDKMAVARDLGATHCLEAESDWLPDVKRLTNDRGVDLVFDPVGGDRFIDSVRALAVGGRLLVVGSGGSIPKW